MAQEPCLYHVQHMLTDRRIQNLH